VQQCQLTDDIYADDLGGCNNTKNALKKSDNAYFRSEIRQQGGKVKIRFTWKYVCCWSSMESDEVHWSGM
jgi:hypothetical protein